MIGKTIGLDYDDTYTTDPHAWFAAMSKLKENGFTIVGATFRSQDEVINDHTYYELCDAVVFCAGQPKDQTARSFGYNINIWIDDHPDWIHSSWIELYGSAFNETAKPSIWINYD